MTIQGIIVQQKGCALRKTEGSPVLRHCEIQGAQHQISMKNYYFLCDVDTCKQSENNGVVDDHIDEHHYFISFGMSA